jgi:hypothetical protein
MKRSTTRVLRAATVLLVAAAAGPRPASALHSVFLSVPSHSEEALTWCGPAVAEMTMEGYPTTACSHLQADVWAAIVGHKVEATWDTDPVGMREALKGLCPPPGTWSVVARTAEDDLMYSVAFWMTQNSFPVPVVLDTAAHRPTVPAHPEHWVLVKGIVTDVNPVGSPTVTLEHIWYTDPSPAAFGDPPIESFIPGGTWSTLLQPVNKPGSAYDGQHVAVIEPPRPRGRVRVKLPALTGRILPAAKALELAKRWVEKIEPLREIEPFKGLQRSRPLKPLLVNPRHGGYYLVPYSADGETASHAILVNAYSGEFQGAGAFARRRYMSDREALKRALRFFGIHRPQRYDVTLVYSPEAGAASLFHPVWRVAVDQHVAAVRQDGSVRRWPKGRE